MEAWCHPANTKKSGKEQAPTEAIRKPSSVQRQGALAITGGFRTSPSDSLDAHASLLPIHLRIRKVNLMQRYA
jgi:hypothetical protein